jgi:hypothetical protein
MHSSLLVLGLLCLVFRCSRYYYETTVEEMVAACDEDPSAHGFLFVPTQRLQLHLRGGDYNYDDGGGGGGDNDASCTGAVAPSGAIPTVIAMVGYGRLLNGLGVASMERTEGGNQEFVCMDHAAADDLNDATGTRVSVWVKRGLEPDSNASVMAAGKEKARDGNDANTSESGGGGGHARDHRDSGHLQGLPKDLQWPLPLPLPAGGRAKSWLGHTGNMSNARTTSLSSSPSLKHMMHIGGAGTAVGNTHSEGGGGRVHMHVATDIAGMSYADVVAHSQVQLEADLLALKKQHQVLH